MKGKMMGFNDDVPKGRDVKETRQLSTEARESHRDGTNSTNRNTVRHGAFGKLGAKGHPK